jgi:cell fate regulator YaaT (PSP1 superfamily)
MVQPTSEDQEVYPDQVAVVGVKVRDLGEVKKTRTDDHSIKVGDWVLLDMEPDQTFGKVYLSPQFFPFTPPMRVMRKIIRKANEEDQRQIARQQQLAQEGRDFCQERIAALDLDMSLVEVFGSCVQRSLTFTYTADERIDFRQLVKDLARRFGCRIEMRQISTREEAARIGGVDTCGLVLCCSSFLTDFKPVYPRGRADAPMNGMDSHRIGVCGRVKCCLLYEEDNWTLTRRKPQPLIRPTKR